jgi:hypothetical protein
MVHRLLASLIATTLFACAQTTPPEWAVRLVDEVQAASFPELSSIRISVRCFSSDSDYFRARFSIPRFLVGAKMRYFVEVNFTPALVTAPEEDRRAIVAHELAHVAYYAGHKRIFLFGLVRLGNKGSRARFERDADAQAIRLGYAKGLKEYRMWLYQHVPAWALAEKKRDYLSPEEIEALASGK